MRERELAALREHDVEIELLRHLLVKLHAFLVEGDALRRDVVRANGGGVASGIAAGKVAFLQDSDIPDAVVFGEVMRASEAMSAAADDHDVIGGSQLRCLRNVATHRVSPAETIFQQSERHVSGSRGQWLIEQRRQLGEATAGRGETEYALLQRGSAAVAQYRCGEFDIFADDIRTGERRLRA